MHKLEDGEAVETLVIGLLKRLDAGNDGGGIVLGAGRSGGEGGEQDCQKRQETFHG